MTVPSSSAAALRRVLVLDAVALAPSGGPPLDRLSDRIAAVRQETVLIYLGTPPMGGAPLPEPDYIVEADGRRIIRLPSFEELEDWPADAASVGEAAAIVYLAHALMVSPSEIQCVIGPDRGADGAWPGQVAIVGGEGPPSHGTWVEHLDDDALVDTLQHLFAPVGVGATDVCDDAFDMAIDTLRRNVTDLGFTAASIADNPLMSHDSNYAAVWARDGVVTGLWTLGLDDPEITSCFERTLRVLARHQSPSGQIPANVRIEGETPDYSGIGGIASIDSVLWFVIGVARYAFHAKDREFAEEMCEPVERAMAWLSAHDANNDGLIEIPESSDWMDLFPRSYNVLYDEVLWYQATRDTATLLEALGRDASGWQDHSQRIRERIVELFWPNGEQLVELAGGSSGRFSAGEAQYLVSQVTPFDYGWRCDVYANLLAALTGLLDERKSERLFHFLWGVGVNAPFPVKVLYPTIHSGADDWKDYFLVNFLNLPHHYHNGGIWPFVGGLWVRYLHSIGRVELAHRELNALAEACKLGRDDEWEFNEWLHGGTGRPMGKAHQAWSAASFVQAYMALHKGSEPAAFLPLDPADLHPS